MQITSPGKIWAIISSVKVTIRFGSTSPKPVNSFAFNTLPPWSIATNPVLVDGSIPINLI
ncbi:Uncharacterised protein [Chlamydia trachomatis]|nr:Uncharacterised protein [Chlamydia trachomatis]